VTSLFGILVVEREPVGFVHLPGQLQVWLQDVGGFAAAGLFLWVLFAKLAPRSDTQAGGQRVTGFMLLMLTLAMLCYAARGAAGQILEAPDTSLYEAIRTEGPNPFAPPPFKWDVRSLLLMVGGFFAILGAGQPFFTDLLKMRWRRIWALAVISYKEAVRKRVLWVFLAFLIVFLFPPKWFFTIKAEDELRTNVSVIYWAMTPLLVLTAALLASFSIPTDIRQQTIHTIVTKPVERFEIVLGRFIGFVMLMSVILFTLTGFSLLLIRASNVDDLARTESLQARDPVYGKLGFAARNKEAGWQGDSVGREWDYRKYIAGASSQRAVWYFDYIPSDLANRSADQYIPMEFAFDIFRTTKGEENRGVKVSVEILTWQFDPEKMRDFEDAARDVEILGRNIRPDDPKWAKANELAEKFGYFEFRAKQVIDYHTLSIELPPGLFKSAREGTPPMVDDGQGGQTSAARLRVIVRCDSPTQFIGMAQSDLYVLRANGSFELNFFKGALGLWCRLCLVIGIAVACSTLLHGMLAFLVATFLFIAGIFQEYILTLALGSSIGGGPAEALNRLVKGDNLTIQLDPTPTVQVAQAFDAVYGWILRRFINVIPDVERFSWTGYVAEGFNISPEFLVINFLFLFAYLLPWGILAYYLMRSREIATW